MKRRTNAGFTLAEAAITIALVGLTLSSTLQIMQGSKFMAAHTRDQKIARDLALRTLGEIEAGMWWDEIESVRVGNYAEDDYPDFHFELAIGDESFMNSYEEEDEYDQRHDSFEHRRQLREDEEAELGLDEDEEEQTEPFEKIRIRISFPKYGELSNELTLEKWIPWEQVYGVDEEEEEAAAQDTGQSPPGDTGEGDG